MMRPSPEEPGLRPNPLDLLLSRSSNIATIASVVAAAALGLWAAIGESWIPVGVATFIAAAVAIPLVPISLMRVRQRLLGQDAPFQPLDPAAHDRLQTLLVRISESNEAAVKQIAMSLADIARDNATLSQQTAALKATLEPRTIPLLRADSETSRFYAIERAQAELQSVPAKLSRSSERTSVLMFIAFHDHRKRMKATATPITNFIQKPQPTPEQFATIEPYLDGWHWHAEVVGRIAKNYDREQSEFVFGADSSDLLTRDWVREKGLYLPDALWTDVENSLAQRLPSSAIFRLQNFWLQKQALESVEQTVSTAIFDIT